MNGFNCETCGTGLIDQCHRCGAPQCCPKCCASMTPTQPTHTTTEVTEAMVEQALAVMVIAHTLTFHEAETRMRAALSTAPSGDGVPGMVLVKDGDPVTLDDCPEGLFLFGDTLAMMSEYATMAGSVRQRDAFIVDSGEYFWGGTSKATDRAKLIVQPLSAASTDGETK